MQVLALAIFAKAKNANASTCYVGVSRMEDNMEIFIMVLFVLAIFFLIMVLFVLAIFFLLFDQN
jgi:hypothetical protein